MNQTTFVECIQYSKVLCILFYEVISQSRVYRQGGFFDTRRIFDRISLFPDMPHGFTLLAYIPYMGREAYKG